MGQTNLFTIATCKNRPKRAKADCQQSSTN